MTNVFNIYLATALLIAIFAVLYPLRYVPDGEVTFGVSLLISAGAVFWARKKITNLREGVPLWIFWGGLLFIGLAAIFHAL